jgi:hypothetical protein
MSLLVALHSSAVRLITGNLSTGSCIWAKTIDKFEPENRLQLNRATAQALHASPRELPMREGESNHEFISSAADKTI